MGMNLPKWSITLLMLAFAVFAMAGENGVNSYTLGWSETHATDTDVYWGVSGPFDFDDDGFPEVIAYSDEGGLTLHMYENQGDDMWVEVFMHDIADAGDSYEVADQVTDLDGNGYDEFLVGGSGSSDGTLDALFIFEYDTTYDGSTDLYFTEVAAVNPAEVAGITDDDGEFATSVKSLWAGDLDDDGVTEILLYDGRTYSVQIMSLDTSSTFSFPNWILEFTDPSFTNSAYGVVTGDFDANGTNNFAMVEWDQNDISFFEVNGADDYELIMWVDNPTEFGGGSLRSLDVADADADGYDEIYLASTAGVVVMFHVGTDLYDFDVDLDVYEIFEYDYGFNGAKIGNTDIWHGSRDGIDYIITTDSTTLIDLEYDGIGDITSADSWTAYEIPNADSPGEWQDVVLGDFDYDGLDEIFAVNRRDVLCQVYEHDGWNWVPNVTTYPMMALSDSLQSQTRGLTAGSDLDQDGMLEVIITDYAVNGVHVYEVVGDNTLEWVATMRDDSTSYGYTPRHVITGDLDNNDRGEIIYMGMTSITEGNNGVNVWEWDGVVGSDNYTRHVLPILIDGVEVDRYYGEKTMITADVDADGQEELLVSVNGSDNSSDVFVIASIQGNFSGFHDMVIEYSNVRTVSGDFNGSPWGQPNYGDLDGDGDMEALFFAWDHAKLLIVEAIGTDDYELQTVVQLDSASIDRANYGTAFVSDLDADGADELYVGLYDNNLPGNLLKVTGGSDVADISYANGNITEISDFGASWGITGGNVDDDAEAEIFSVDYSHGRIYQWDMNGTSWDMGVVSNWDAVMGGFDLEYVPDLDGDSYPEVVCAFIEPSYIFANDDSLNTANPYRYTFAVSEFGGAVDVDSKWTIIHPEDYQLAQNYPNPFNPTTTIEFTLPLAKDNVNLTIYNMLGQEVVRLADNASYGPGTHSVSWNSLTANGTPAAAGVYIYELRSGNVSKTAKMTLIK